MYLVIGIDGNKEIYISGAGETPEAAVKMHIKNKIETKYKVFRPMEDDFFEELTNFLATYFPIEEAENRTIEVVASIICKVLKGMKE